MPFGITGFGAETHFIEISEAEFQRLKLAKNQLASSLAIEAKFDLVLGNYAEFEHEILILAAQKMVYSGLSWSSMHVDTQKVNRRVVNLLSAGRLYIDQTKHEAHSLGERPLVELLQETASQQYRAKLGYRALEELRNYTQHRDLPVHGLKYQSAWSPSKDGRNFVQTMGSTSWISFGKVEYLKRSEAAGFIWTSHVYNSLCECGYVSGILTTDIVDLMKLFSDLFRNALAGIDTIWAARFVDSSLSATPESFPDRFPSVIAHGFLLRSKTSGLISHSTRRYDGLDHGAFLRGCGAGDRNT